MTKSETLAKWESDCATLRAAILSGQRPTFVVRAIPDGNFWYIEIDGVPRHGDSPGAFTQARSTDEIEPMARDVTAVVLEVPHDSFDLSVRLEPDQTLTVG